MSKYLGQHFLKNKTAIEKIVVVLDLKENDTVVEIGPGHGELTFELFKHPINIIAIEKDQKLVDFLNQKLKIKNKNNNEKFKIIYGDILKILPELTSKLEARSYKLIGNIPYYLTGYLLRVIGELGNKPSLIVFTIQKEVAERICAQPPRMNLLAASIQIWAKPEIIDIIPAKDFSPSPKINSAIIRLRIKNKELGIREVELEKYYQFIKILFKQPRKTILNNLSEGLNLPKEKIVGKLNEICLSGGERPQNLSIEKIIELTKIIF